MSVRTIAASLKDQGLIRSAFFFRMLVRFYGVDQQLRPGSYQFPIGMTPEAILHELLRGRVTTVPVTIPEGLTLDRIATLLDTAGICSASVFLSTAGNPDLLRELFSDWGDVSHAEGLLWPDTYRFPPGTAADQVARTMFRQTRYHVGRVLAQADSPLSPYRLCILASIVERETKLKSELPLVASVFHNRLQKQMKLESCATVLYALPTFKSRLTFADLEVDSPYNTYREPGLPPTPIANFGRHALQATAFPAATDYLFFVSDNESGHHFSTSLRDHERFRQDYFRARRTSGGQ